MMIIIFQAPFEQNHTVQTANKHIISTLLLMLYKFYLLMRKHKDKNLTVMIQSNVYLSFLYHKTNYKCYFPAKSPCNI